MQHHGGFILVRFKIVLDDLKGFLQPKWICDSLIKLLLSLAIQHLQTPQRAKVHFLFLFWQGKKNYLGSEIKKLSLKLTYISFLLCTI